MRPMERGLSLVMPVPARDPSVDAPGVNAVPDVSRPRGRVCGVCGVWRLGVLPAALDPGVSVSLRRDTSASSLKLRLRLVPRLRVLTALPGAMNDCDMLAADFKRSISLQN